MTEVPIELDSLLRDSARNGAYFVDVRDRAALVAAGIQIGLHVACADLRGCEDQAAGLPRIAQALEFPDWFGDNWDALADSLSDLSWLQGDGDKPLTGVLLLLDHGDDWHEADGTGFATLIEVLQDAADAWREAGTPFWAMLPLPAHLLPPAGTDHATSA